MSKLITLNNLRDNSSTWQEEQNEDIKSKINLRNIANKEFFAEIEKLQSSLTNQTKLSEFYQNSLSKNENNFKKVYSANIKLLNDLLDDYPVNISLPFHRQTLLLDLTSKFVSIFNQGDTVKNTEINKDLKGIAEQAEEDIKSDSAKRDEAFRKSLPEEILKTMDIQSKKNQQFARKINTDYETLKKEFENSNELAIETEKFCENSLLTGQQNLKQIMVTIIENFNMLALKYPEHQESTEIIKTRLIKNLHNEFTKMFNNSGSAAYYPLYKEKLLAIVNNEVSANKLVQERKFKVEQIQERQAKRQNIFDEAATIRAGSNGSNPIINQKDINRNFKQEKKDLEAALQALKNDIYELVDLKKQTQDKKEHFHIDQQLKHFLKDYEKVKEKGPSRRKTLLQEGSKSYNFVMNRDEDTIARMMHDLHKQNKQNSYADYPFNIEQFLKNAPPEVVLKINNIQNKIDQRSQLANQGQTGGLKENIGKFFNFLKTIIGRGVSNDDLKNLHQDMIQESKEFSVISRESAIHPELHEIKNNLGKFVFDNFSQYTNQHKTAQTSNVDNKVPKELANSKNQQSDASGKSTDSAPTLAQMVAGTQKSELTVVKQPDHVKDAKNIGEQALVHVADSTTSTTPKKAVEILNKLREKKANEKVDSPDNTKIKNKQENSNGIKRKLRNKGR